jgi:hypothetical protein
MMRTGLMILCLIPVSLALLILNCVSWVVARLRVGLPVREGVGWPWHYYTYAVNKVGPSEWRTEAFLLDLALALGILAATALLVFLLTRGRTEEGWR